MISTDVHVRVLSSPEGKSDQMSFDTPSQALDWLVKTHPKLSICHFEVNFIGKRNLTLELRGTELRTILQSENL